LSLALIQPEQRRFAEESLAREAALSDEESAKASAAVAKFLPDSSMPNILNEPWLPSMVAASGLAFYVALPAIVAALAFRGGLILRLAGVTFVRADGLLASRPRLFLRSLLTWCCLGFGLALFILLKPSLGIMGASAVAWLLLGILAGLSLAMPARGLPDRIAGTWPVLR
jgi:hypothetical protein